MSSDLSDGMTPILNSDLLRDFPAHSFRNTQPFPWWNFQGFLTDAMFQVLCDDFPKLDLFEKHVGLDRPHGQRPHNRYYLAYETSIYHRDPLENSPSPGRVTGVVDHQCLAPSWQAFIDELTSRDYLSFVRSCTGVSDVCVRFAWHVGEGGSEVSAHVDAPDKAATHIFYFNPPDAWDPSWGGATLVLGDKLVEGMNPDFDDFGTVSTVDIQGNSSFLFKNTPTAWHGVRALSCPEGGQRRLFNAIFEHPDGAPVRPVPGLAAFRSKLGRIVGSRSRRSSNSSGGGTDVG